MYRAVCKDEAALAAALVIFKLANIALVILQNPSAQSVKLIGPKLPYIAATVAEIKCAAALTSPLQVAARVSVASRVSHGAFAISRLSIDNLAVIHRAVLIPITG